MKSIRYIITLWFVATTLATAATTDAMRERLQQAVSHVCERDTIKGVSVSVRWDNDHWQGVAGISHPGTPIDPSMLFGIGSNTKTLTSLVLLRLQEEGILDLDSTIATWFADRTNIDGSITIRQLLNHTSGLGDYSATTTYRQSVGNNTSRIFTEADILPMIPEPMFAPGNGWQYCNTNYFLAGLIATKVTGKTLGSLFRNYIYEPLGLEQTFLGVEDSLRGDVAHRWLGPTDASGMSINAAFSGAWAAGAVFSTPSDMTVLYNGLFSGKLLGQDAMQEMLAFTGPQDYGLGISRKVLGGASIIGHSGEIRGYASVMVRVPSLRASISVLTNTAQANAAAVADTIIRILREEPVSAGDDPSGVSLRPLPASDHVVVDGYMGTVEVVNLSGIPVQSLQNEPGMRLDLSEVPAGTYVVRIGGVSFVLPVIR
ncbi:MAG: hypothetical protein FGM24_02825 [Candidatus Kapabacteria bacterium]|nr:hypothetical protein [Candidatus Kapabacteria bacterium]